MNADKLRYSLINPDALREVVRVLMLGAHRDKGRTPGYLRLRDAERLYTDALLRHLEEYRSGRETDPDHGDTYHLSHVAANAVILLTIFLRRKKRSDLRKKLFDSAPRATHHPNTTKRGPKRRRAKKT